MELIGLAVVLAVGGLLILSGLAKLQAGTFASDLANYRILPRTWVIPTATILPWVELGLGTAVLLSLTPAPLLLGAALLLSAFTVGIVTNLLRGRHISCGCRGTAKPITWRLAATNVAWTLAAVIAAGYAPGALPTLLGDAEVSASEGAAVAITVTLVALLVRLVGSLRRVLPVIARVDAAADPVSATT